MATPKKHITTEAAAEFLHEVNRMYCKLIGDDSQVNWNNAPQWQKDSAINGVKAIISGKVQEAKDSHQLWFNEKNSQGWKYGKVKEPEKKLHPCMVHYDNLPLEQKTKDLLFFLNTVGIIPMMDKKEVDNIVWNTVSRLA